MKTYSYILILFLYISVTSNSQSIPEAFQPPFVFGKYVHYDTHIPVNADNHITYPNFGFRTTTEQNSYDENAQINLFIKYGLDESGIERNSLKKPFVFVEGVSFEKPVKQNSYSLTEYLNMYNGDSQVSNKQDLINARDSVSSDDWNENATVGYSTFNWATLVTGIDAEGLDDGEPLQVQKSPELLQKLYENGFDIVFVDFQSGQNYIENNGYALSKVLKDIKDSLDNNSSSEKLMVCGASMGGLVSRFAIRDLELNGADKYKTCVGKFISFDAPQMGAI
jgi:hypothetical protein